MVDRLLEELAQLTEGKPAWQQPVGITERRNALILRARMGGVTYKRIAGASGLTPQRISQIVMNERERRIERRERARAEAGYSHAPIKLQLAHADLARNDRAMLALAALVELD